MKRAVRNAASGWATANRSATARPRLSSTGPIGGAHAFVQRSGKCVGHDVPDTAPAP